MDVDCVHTLHTHTTRTPRCRCTRRHARTHHTHACAAPATTLAPAYYRTPHYCLRTATLPPLYAPPPHCTLPHHGSHCAAPLHRCAPHYAHHAHCTITHAVCSTRYAYVYLYLQFTIHEPLCHYNTPACCTSLPSHGSAITAWTYKHLYRAYAAAHAADALTARCRRDTAASLTACARGLFFYCCDTSRLHCRAVCAPVTHGSPPHRLHLLYTTRFTYRRHQTAPSAYLCLRRAFGWRPCVLHVTLRSARAYCCQPPAY